MAESIRGIIKRVVTEKGFGFVRANEIEYFFHRSCVRGDRRFDELKQGDVVQVIPGETTEKGPRAESVIA